MNEIPSPFYFNNDKLPHYSIYFGLIQLRTRSTQYAMAISVNLNLLRKLNSLIDEYQADFCNYYLVAIKMLTSLDIFQKCKRRALNKMSSILVHLHKYNHNLIVYLEVLWSSINYSAGDKIEGELKYLKIVTRKFLKLNNKLNLMNLTISQVWTYINSVDDNHINSFFKLNSVSYCLNALIHGKC